MSQWSQIRRLARQQYEAALIHNGGNSSAAALVHSAVSQAKLQCHALPANDPLLDGGHAALDPESAAIWYSAEAEPGLALFYQAHELAHLWLGDAATPCSGAEIDPEATEARLPLGEHQINAYDPRERRECRANVCAREFLLPCRVLRDLFKQGFDANSIAARFGLPLGLVIHQLARALLIPETDIYADVVLETPDMPPLDHTQLAAAQASNGPLLVEAGPGTGKTRTLVARILHLLDQGVAPDEILALTFSNKAADELRSRIAAIAPSESSSIWAGTFHAFGLELLRRYSNRVGLPPGARVIDPSDALLMMEEALPEIDLGVHSHEYEPAFALREILQAISRAKDEAVGPESYTDFASRAASLAQTEAARAQAARNLVVAQVYSIYQNRLRARGMLDYGDLIVESASLLRVHHDVREEVRARFKHVLVDEYQDVNRASGILLRELAGDGEGLWVVGDARQAIYRFRGAAPRNIRLFTSDFQNACVCSLGVNYRSQAPIVSTIRSFANHMRASRHSSEPSWTASRSMASGVVHLSVATDLDSEVENIARQIKIYHEAGVSYREQAVLCRSHVQIERLAERLEAAGVPVLFLGNLFERDEIRDMLALLAVAGDLSGEGLARVAQFHEYSIPESDVTLLIELASARNVHFPDALGLAAESESISSQGKEGFARLFGHIAGMHFGKQAWSALVDYLFVQSGYIRRLMDNDSLAMQTRRMAIYQLLQFAHAHRRMDIVPRRDPKRNFLDLIRRLELLGEDTALRQVHAEVGELDAVHLLTVHASKGLEYRAIYLPMLGQRYFPAARRAQPYAPPAGILPEDAADDHGEEEECLFFVALSRARDFLHLSRAERYGLQASNPSILLGFIADKVLHTVAIRRRTSLCTYEVSRDAAFSSASDEADDYDARNLETYMLCPRRYYYENVRRYRAYRSSSLHARLRRSVFAVLRWLRDEFSLEADPSAIQVQAQAIARLREIWLTHWPDEEPYTVHYLSYAEAMIRRATVDFQQHRQCRPRHLGVDLQHGRVVVVPDRVEVLDDGTEAFLRYRAGRLSGTEVQRPIYSLYAHGLDLNESATRRRRLQVLSLSTGDRHELQIPESAVAQGLNKYEETISGIRAHRFPARPSDARFCPACPYYFTCPAG